MTIHYRARLWWQLMEQARKAAGLIRDADLRAQMLVIAAKYKVLALHAERETAEEPEKQEEE